MTMHAYTRKTIFLYVHRYTHTYIHTACACTQRVKEVYSARIVPKEEMKERSTHSESHTHTSEVKVRNVCMYVCMYVCMCYAHASSNAISQLWCEEHEFVCDYVCQFSNNIYIYIYIDGPPITENKPQRIERIYIYIYIYIYIQTCIPAPFDGKVINM
jgi:hypothetical protein